MRKSIDTVAIADLMRDLNDKGGPRHYAGTIMLQRQVFDFKPRKFTRIVKTEVESMAKKMVRYIQTDYLVLRKSA